MTVPVAAAPGPAPAPPPRREIPRQDDDYTAAARRRLAFLAEATGARPEHVGRYSFDPGVLDGNIENFIGVVQVPVGIAGPLLVDGEPWAWPAIGSPLTNGSAGTVP
jgi:hydroxymethylglutaryl-CoA reductase